MKRLAVLVLISALSIGCAKRVIHPGAINNLDSYAYDVLLVEQDAINSAKAQYLAGSLPPTAHNLLNAAIDQYNVTQAAWQSFHANGQNQVTLEQAIDALVGAVGAMQQIMQKKPTPVSPAPISKFTSLEVFDVNYAYAA